MKKIACAGRRDIRMAQKRNACTKQAPRV